MDGQRSNVDGWMDGDTALILPAPFLRFDVDLKEPPGLPSVVEALSVVYFSMGEECNQISEA